MLYREIYSSYRAVNTLHHGYKNQAVNAVEGNIQFFDRNKHTPEKSRRPVHYCSSTLLFGFAFRQELITLTF
jgi:hypothetical protein